MDQNEDSPVSRFLKDKSQQTETGGSSTSSETVPMSEQERRTWRNLKLRASKILVHEEDGHIQQILSEVKFRLDDLPNIESSARQSELNSIRAKLDGIDDETKKSEQGRAIIGVIGGIVGLVAIGIVIFGFIGLSQTCDTFPML